MASIPTIIRSIDLSVPPNAYRHHKKTVFSGSYEGGRQARLEVVFKWHYLQHSLPQHACFPGIYAHFPLYYIFMASYQHPRGCGRGREAGKTIHLRQNERVLSAHLKTVYVYQGGTTHTLWQLNSWRSKAPPPQCHYDGRSWKSLFVQFCLVLIWMQIAICFALAIRSNV